MKCPKCPGELQKIQHDHITAEGCSNCRGLLLKPQAVDEVMLFSMVEKYLDIGLPEIGRAWDPIDDIQCPHCTVDMEKVDDPEQPHIWTERCPDCGPCLHRATRTPHRHTGPS